MMSNEDVIQDWIYKILLKKGWEAEREIPTNETLNWKHPNRIDLIIFKSDYQSLNPMGIEIKYL